MAHRTYVPQTINYQNQLVGITPTFSVWNQTPGTSAQFVSEAVANFALNTPGITAGVATYIQYLLPSLKRLDIGLTQFGGGASGASIWVSDDGGANWANKGLAPVEGSAYRIVERVNGIRFYFEPNHTFIVIRLKAYNF